MNKIRAWFDRQNKITQDIIQGVSYCVMFVAITLVVGLLIKRR